MNPESVILGEDDSMKIKECGNAQFIISNIYQQWKDERFCDIVLHVGKDTLRAHRCVLAAASTYFSSIMKDCKTVKEQLEIKCDGSEVLYDVLTYMYSGTINLTEANVCGILKLAVTFHLFILKGYCSNFLETAVKLSNCLDVYQLARSQDLERVKDSSSNFIASHMNEVLDGKQILEISLLRLENFIKSKHWTIPNKEIFPLIISWVYQDTKMREEYFRILLTWISWKGFRCEELLVYLNDHPLFQESQMCKLILFDCFSEHEHLQELVPESWYMSYQKQQVVSNCEDNENFLNYAISTAMINVLPGNEGLFNQDNSYNDINQTAPGAPSEGYSNMIEQSVQDDNIFAHHEWQKKNYYPTRCKGKYLHKDSEQHNYSKSNCQEVLEEQQTYSSSNFHVLEEQQNYSSSNCLELEEQQNYPSSNCPDVLEKQQNYPSSNCPDVLEKQQNYSLTNYPEMLEAHDNYSPINYSEVLQENQNYSSSNCPEELAEQQRYTSSSCTEVPVLEDQQDYSISNCPVIPVSKEDLNFSSSICHKLLDASQKPFEIYAKADDFEDRLKDSISLAKNEALENKKEHSFTSFDREESEDVIQHLPISKPNDSYPYEISPLEQLPPDIIKDPSENNLSSNNYSKSHLKASISPLKKRIVRESGFCKSCTQCTSTFREKRVYFKHMRIHFPGPPHVCNICNASFKRIYYLLGHLETHSEEKLLQCRSCSFTTKRIFNLKEHERIKHSTEDKDFTCPQCCMGFHRKQHLEIHMTKHTNDRPMVCEACGSRWKTRDSLLIHFRTHTGKLYSCQYSNCAYRTPKLSHLKEHLQYHIKARPFQCNSCEKAFISKSHLQRHRKKHVNFDSYQCQNCGYSTTRLDVLKLHIKRNHNQPPVKKITPRKLQFKKKDGFKFMHSEVTLNSTKEPNQEQLSLIDDIVENGTLCLSSFEGSNPSSCTFEAPGDHDEPLMIASEIEDNEGLANFADLETPFKHLHS